MSSTILFSSPREDWGFLSTWFSSPFTVNDVEYKSAAHYYEAHKFVFGDDGETGKPEGEFEDGFFSGIFDKIVGARKAKEAHELAMEYDEYKRTDWELQKYWVMYNAHCFKYSENQDMLNMLLDTGKRNLVWHTRKDSYFGDGGDGSGANILGGEILESVRRTLNPECTAQDDEWDEFEDGMGMDSLSTLDNNSSSNVCNVWTKICIDGIKETPISVDTEEELETEIAHFAFRKRETEYVTNEGKGSKENQPVCGLCEESIKKQEDGNSGSKKKRGGRRNKGGSDGNSHACTLFNRTTYNFHCFDNDVNAEGHFVHVFHEHCLSAYVVEHQYYPNVSCPCCGGTGTSTKSTSSSSLGSSSSSSGETIIPYIPDENAILGIDVGGVLVSKSGDADTSFFSDNFLETPEVEDSFETVQRLGTTLFDSERMHIVSKAKTQITQKTLDWMKDRNFVSRTGFLMDNVHFVREREDKVPVCRDNNITHFIDDHVQVLELVGQVVPHLFLLCPNGEEDDRERRLAARNKKLCITVVNSWAEFEKVLNEGRQE